MPDPRVVAATVIASLLRQHGSLATLLPEALSQLPERERQFCQELCYGTARWFPRLNRLLEQLLEKPLRNKDRDVAGLLMIGLYQLIYLRTPDHAAISATVEAAKALKKPWAKGLVNGVLRRYQREADALNSRLADDAVYRCAHPQWLIDVVRQAWPAEAESVFAANNARPPLTLRINRQWTSREDYLQRLQQQNIAAAPCRHSMDGIVLRDAISVNKLLDFADGAVSVQDEAPQLCASLMQLEPGLRVLDACSAPGGKTAHLMETEAALREVVALDISAKRNQRTAQNLQRLKLKATLVTGDASRPQTWFDGEAFDRILLDAPCSATGIIRRQPDIKILRGPQAVAKLVTTQQQLLQALWPLLKPGGILLYATCSILPAENVELVEHFITQTPGAQPLAFDAEWGLPQAVGRQLLPAVDGADGFFYARLCKAGNPGD